MAPFTVSTRGVVLGGKAENSLHSDLQELGRDDVKGALRVDAATNVKDTDLVFTTTDHTVRTVRLCGVFNGGGGHGPRASPTDERERRRGRRKKKRQQLVERSPDAPRAALGRLWRCSVADGGCARAASRRWAHVSAF